MPDQQKSPSPTEVAEAMLRDDAASKSLGLTVTHADLGTATVTMTVTAEMVNGLGVCHGGFLFTLADSAMAYASNAANERTLATGASIEFVSPAKLGSVLKAVSEVRHHRGRNAVHDINVTDQDGELVAVFRGRTLTLGGAIVDAEPPA